MTNTKKKYLCINSVTCLNNRKIYANKIYKASLEGPHHTTGVMYWTIYEISQTRFNSEVQWFVASVNEAFFEENFLLQEDIIEEVDRLFDEFFFDKK